MAPPFRWIPILLFAAVTVPLHAQPVLSVSSAFDGSAPPFLRTEMVVVSLTGVEPFRPVTIFMGSAGVPAPVTGIDGLLGIAPGTIAPFGPYDGLGLFGGSLPLHANGAGSVSIPVVVPAGFGAPGPLPAALSLQAVVLQNPFASPTGSALRFSSTATFSVVEPATSPVITGFADVANAPLHSFAEGGAARVRILGTGFLAHATVVPQVTFEPTCAPGPPVAATNVQIVDVDPGPGVTPALELTPPPFLGAPTMPPNTSAGPVLVRVRYSVTALYPNNPANGDTVTAPTGINDPTYFVYQSPFVPLVTSISPHAALTTPVCPVTITGGGFLQCAQVIFGAGTANEVAATNVTVLSGTQITADPPPMGQSLVGVAVRNPDHHPSSPRQSALSPPLTDFAYFSFAPASLTVTAISPATIVEGTGGASIFITVTGPSVGGYTALSLLSGTTAATLGSTLNGMDASVPLTVVDIVVSAPGVSMVHAIAPSYPPGLNPVGPAAGGRGNAGVKNVQIVAPPCLNPSALPHLPLAAIPGAEPGNRVTYLAQSAPVITSIEPNNVGRVDGGQFVVVRGMNFFTNDTVLPSMSAALGPAVALVTALPAAPMASVAILDDTTIFVLTPDLGGAGLTLPLTTDLRVTNPDGQANVLTGTVDDFVLVPSLAPTVANPFPTAPGTLVIDTTPLGVPQVFSFNGDITLPASLLLQAEGDAPLIIRARGDVAIVGTIDLGGATVTKAPYFHPAGAGRGGLGAAAASLGTEDPFQGRFGGSPSDPLTMGPYNGFGQGGFHGVPDAGGGGGGALLVAGAAGAPPLGGAGGLAYGLTALPLPVLGSGTPGETAWPPGGSGGAAGGMGTPPPFNPSAPPPAADIGFGGSGGNGGGGVIIAADGIITVAGSLLVDGQSGAPGQPATNTAFAGGGGGGGAGGAIVLQAIQGIRVQAGATLRALGGAAGAGAGAGNAGGAGATGGIRLAIPLGSANGAATLVVDPAATLSPPPDTTRFP